MALPTMSQRWPMFAGAFVCSALLGVLMSFFVQRAGHGDHALWGVEFAGTPLTGLDDHEIEQRLLKPAHKLSQASVTLQLASRSRSFRLAELGVGLNLRSTASLALRAGRERGMAGEMAAFLRAFLPSAGAPTRAVVDVSDEKLRQVLKPWLGPVLRPARLPSLIGRSSLQVDEGQVGETVDYQQLAQQLRQHAFDVVQKTARPGSAQQPILTLSTVDEPPSVDPASVKKSKRQLEQLMAAPLMFVSETGQQLSINPKQWTAVVHGVIDAPGRTLTLELDIEQLRAKMRAFLGELERPARDASFEMIRGKEPHILPSEVGAGLDGAELVRRIWAASATEQRQVLVPLTITQPKLTTLQAESLHIKELVASFVTKHACCQPRVDNIHTAAARLDNTVVVPGGRFSLNSVLGPRTPASGYKSAPTIVRGEMEDVYGGGISQLATTLFNAALRGGYKIVQRQPHSIYFSRYPEGHEATVSYPEPDLIFENDSAAGLLIKTEYSGTFIKVLIYGDTGGRITSVGKSPRYDVVQPPVEYEPDERLDPEKPKRARAGQMGWKLKVWRTVTLSDGQKSEEKREVVYQPRSEIMRIHPCKLPEDHKDYTGERCPEPDEIKEVDREEELSDDVYYDTNQLEYDEEGG